MITYGFHADHVDFHIILNVLEDQDLPPPGRGH